MARATPVPCSSIMNPAVSTASAKTSEKRRKPLEIERVIIWLIDSNMNVDKKDFIIVCLRKTINHVETFTLIDRCLGYINNVKRQRISLIIPDLGKEIVTFIEHNLSIDSVYIFPSKNQFNRDHWSSKLRKVKGLFENFESMHTALKDDVLNLDSSALAFDILSPLPIDDGIDYDENRRNKQEATFMYSHLMRELFLRMTHDGTKDMIRFCRAHYKDNPAQLQLIDEFENEYEPTKAIQWYTRDSFLYRIINIGTREQDLFILVSMRPFICQLHEQIAHYHRIQQQGNFVEPPFLYRGQKLPNDVFEKLKRSEGCLTSFSNFFSTTELQGLALIYAGESDDELTSLIFEIELNRSKKETTSPYACIKLLSHFGSGEQEWLFTMGTVFRIQKVEKRMDGMWYINLTPTNEHDEQLYKMTAHLRKEFRVETNDPIATFINLIQDMGHYKEAIAVLKVEENSTNDWKHRAHVCQNIAINYAKLHNYLAAIEYLDRSLMINQSNGVTEFDYTLAGVYLCLGSVYAEMEGYDELAVQYLKQALECELIGSEQNPDKKAIAKIYNNLGVILSKNGKIEESLAYYKLAYDIRTKLYPSNHPEIAYLKINMGGLHHRVGRYQDALTLYEQALFIEKKFLHPNNLKIADTYECIASVLYRLNRITEASAHFKEALSIKLKHFHPDHASLTKLYDNLALSYFEQKQYVEALEYFSKSIDCQKFQMNNNSSIQKSTLASAYNYKSIIFENQHQYEKALEYLMKAIDTAVQTVGEEEYETKTYKNNLQKLCNKMA